jgi:hypothetical protein
MKSIVPVSIVLVFILAGCLAAKPTDKSPPGEPLVRALASFSQIGFDAPGGLQLIYDAPAGANVTYLLNYGYAPKPRATWQACGSLAAFVATNGKVDFDRHLLRPVIDSNGHAVMIASGQHPTIIENGAASETLLLDLSEEINATGITVRPGEQIVLEVAYRSTPNSPIQGNVSFVSDRPLAFNRSVQFRHECVTNLSGFSGEFAMQGFNPAITIIKEATRTFSMEWPGYAMALFFPDPRAESVCELDILVNGSAQSTTGRQTGYCFLETAVPVGNIGFRLKDTVAVGPHIHFMVREYPPQVIQGSYA